MKKALLVLMISALAVSAVSANAQFGGLGGFGKKKNTTPAPAAQPAPCATPNTGTTSAATPASANAAAPKDTSASTTIDPATATTGTPANAVAPKPPCVVAGPGVGASMGLMASHSQDLIGLVTLATDQGMMAFNILVSGFPAEKVVHFREISKQYHDAQATSTDKNIDAARLQLASEAAAEFANLSDNWQSYSHDKDKYIPQADHRLALMMAADGLALLNAPAALQSVQAQVSAISSNPMQIRKLRQLQLTVQLLIEVGKQVPGQVANFKKVRGSVKNIAAAQNMTLPPDPSANSMKDPVKVTASINELPPDEAPIPAAGTTPPPVPAAVPAASTM